MGINYYLIGSAGEFDDMRSRNVVSVGWEPNMDLSHLYGKAHQDIINYLKVNGDEKGRKSYSSLKHFLHLKPGDVVAIKTWNMAAGLKVLAYARVVERNGMVYSYDKGRSMPHMVNVEYLDKPAATFQFHYAETIHHVIDTNLIKEIFGGIGMEATVNQRRDISPEIANLLGALSSVEKAHGADSSIWDDGATMIKGLEQKDQGWVKDAFNVIPGGKPGGCHDTLIVAIGRHDDVEKRILQAFAHVTAFCKEHTTSVVFWAVVFDFMIWKKYRSLFKSVQVTLRPPSGAETDLS